MAFLTHSKKVATAATLAGSIFVSSGLTTAAITPSIVSTPTSEQVTGTTIKAETAVFLSLLCKHYGRCRR